MSDNIKDLAAAFARAQGKVENATKLSNNPHFKSKYADLAQVWSTIRESFTSEGLAIIQFPCEAGEGRIGVRTIVTHSSGQSIEERFSMGIKEPNNPQAAGSAYTYARRYSLMAVAGIGSEDDDGNAAAGKPGPSLPAVDYSSAFAEALTKLNTATDEEARKLYAEVRNSCMAEPHKTGLLKQMYENIQARTETKTIKTTKGTK